MEKGTKDGSVTKRKRKRETAKRVLDVMEDKAKQQIECSQQLEHTMKGIYYRLSSIQRILENNAWEKKMNSHYHLWINGEFAKTRKLPREVTSMDGGANDMPPSRPTTQLYHATVRRESPNFTGDFPQFVPNQMSGEVPEMFSTNVALRQNKAPSSELNSTLRGHQLQDLPSVPAADGGRNDDPNPSPHEGQSGQPSSAASDLQRHRSAPCACEQRQGLHSGRSGDGAHPSKGTSSVKITNQGETQVFSEQALESAFDEDVVLDTKLEPSERLFMEDYPELDKDFEPKRQYPLPYTPGQNYTGKFCEAQIFTDEDLQNAFEVDGVTDVELQSCEKSFTSEHPLVASPESSGHFIEMTSSGAGPTKKEGACPCGGAGVVKRSCPMKKRRALEMHGGEPMAVPTRQPDRSPVTNAEQPTGGGEPQYFSDKDLENVFDESVIDVTLEPNERLFMTEYPELITHFDSKRDYPLPYTPIQYYSGKFCEAQQFSDEELEKAFDIEEIPMVELQPDDEVLIQFPLLAGSESSGPLSEAQVGPLTSLAQETETVASTARTMPPSISALRVLVSSEQDVRSERTCTCGRKITNLVCPKIRARLGLEKQTRVSLHADSNLQQNVSSNAVKSESSTPRFAESQVFDEEELERVFEEEEIPDVVLDFNEKLFMKEYPLMDKDFEPKRHYPLPFTPGQRHRGTTCDAQQFTHEELQKAFDEEEIPEIDLKPNERLFMLEFPSLAGDWMPKAGEGQPATSASVLYGQVSNATTSAKVITNTQFASASRVPGKRCCTCGRIISGIVCPETQEAPTSQSLAQTSDSYQLKSAPLGSAEAVAGQPQAFDDEELAHIFEEQPVPDVTLDPSERLFMKEYPELDNDFEPKRKYPLPYTPGQEYAGSFCEAQTFSDNELEQAFNTEYIPDVHLQSNERVFMMDFPSLAGEWISEGALTSVRTVQSSANGVPSETSTGRAAISSVVRCRNCGKRLARVCPMKRVSADQHEPNDVDQIKFGRAISPPVGYKNAPDFPAATVSQKHTAGAGEPHVFDDIELENVFDEETIPDVVLEPNERLFMKEYPELDKDFEKLREYPLPYTPRQTYSGKFWAAQIFTAEELEKAFDSEDIPEVNLEPNDNLFVAEFPSLAGNLSTVVPSAKIIITGRAQRCCVCGKLKPLESPSS